MIDTTFFVHVNVQIFWLQFSASIAVDNVSVYTFGILWWHPSDHALRAKSKQNVNGFSNPYGLLIFFISLAEIAWIDWIG